MTREKGVLIKGELSDNLVSTIFSRILAPFFYKDMVQTVVIYSFNVKSGDFNTDQFLTISITILQSNNTYVYRAYNSSNNT